MSIKLGKRAQSKKVVGIKITKAQNVPRDRNGKLICKFTVKGTVAALPGCVRKRKLSTASTRFLMRQVVKIP